MIVELHFLRIKISILRKSQKHLKYKETILSYFHFKRIIIPAIRTKIKIANQSSLEAHLYDLAGLIKCNYNN